MNSKAYYDENAVRHGQESVASLVLRTKTLPSCPTEIDWAVFFLSCIAGSNGNCLDIGCAQLTLLQSLSGQFESRTGIDISEYASWSAHSDITTKICNLDEGPMPFSDETFDAVTMLMVLEHVFNPYHAIRELRRVCKNDGYIVLAVPNLAGLRNRLTLLRGRLPVTSARFSFREGAWDGYHLHNFTQASLEWLLRREGLKPIRWAASGRFQRLKKLGLSLFGADLIVLCQPRRPEPGLPIDF